MSINLISFITQYLTPEVIAKISFALGLDKSTAGKAIAAAVPGLLAGLSGVASTPAGSRKLFDAVKQQPPLALDNLAGLFGGSGAKAVLDNGTNMLTSVLGGSGLSGLGDAVAKFAGLGRGASSSLLGLLAPVVMGALGQKAAGLDASGLAQLLTSQKSNISAALPSGFSEMLGSSGLLGALGAGAASPAATAAPRAVAATANRAAAQASGGWPQWLTWALPALAVLALGWMYFGRPAPTAVEEAKTTATQAAQGVADQTRQAAGQVAQAAANFAEQAKAAAAPALKSLQDVTAGGVNVGTAMQTAMTQLTDSLKGITDAASAKAALPKLQEATSRSLNHEPPQTAIPCSNGLLEQNPFKMTHPGSVIPGLRSSARDP